MKARYHCKALSIYQGHEGDWFLEITVLEEHKNAPKGSSGRTSQLQSIDFVNGVAITRNSVYIFEPSDLKERR